MDLRVHTGRGGNVRILMAVVSDLSSDARVQREAAVLVEAGHRVGVVGFDYSVRRAVRRRIDGVEYQMLPFPPRGASRLRRLLGAALFMMRAAAILLASRADAFHAHNLHLAIPCMLSAWLRRAGLVYDAHELVAPMVRQRLRGLTVWYERQVWRRADAVITTNPSRARFLRRLHGGELPLVLGNYPVEPHRIEPVDLRQRLSIPADHLVLIYQGGLYVNDRCFEGVMDALRELPNWHWVLIGFGSPQNLTRIRSFAVAAGIGHRIHILPKVPLHELLNLTAGADVGVVPLRHVNLNNYLGDTNKLFEYLMAGIPAVGSAFPEVHRALLNNPEGRVGEVFSPEDPSTIARAIKELEGDLPELKQRAASVGRLRYSWTAEGRKLQQLYAHWPTSTKHPGLDSEVVHDMQQARTSARTLWGRLPAGTGLASSPWGSAKFYEEMRRTRYLQQPWHQELLRAYSGQRLLEIGCGAGTDLAELGRQFTHVVGIDLAETGARLAGGSLAHWGVDGSTLAADGESLPFEDGSFDFVYSFGVLHHTDDPDRALQEIHRVLRPGGRVVIGLYHRWSLFAAERLLRYILGMRFRHEPWNDFLARCEQGAVEHGVRPRLQLYSGRSARRLLSGFDEIRIRSVHAAGFRASDRVAVGRLAAKFWGWYLIVEGVR